MEKDFYRNNIAPIFNFLGWRASTHTIQGRAKDGAADQVEISSVMNRAGEVVDPVVVAKLCEAFGEAVATPEPATVAEEKPIITMAPEGADPEPGKSENYGPFELDYENLTPTDRERLSKYAKLEITVKQENLGKTVKAPFEASGWEYVGNFYGDGSFVFGAVRDAAGRIVDPWMVKTVIEEMSVLESANTDEEEAATEEEEEEDDTRGLHEAVKRAAEKNLGPVEVSEGGGPQLADVPPGTVFPPSWVPSSLVPPGAPMMWSQTTYKMQPGATPAVDCVIMADGNVQIKLDIGAGNQIFIICSAGQGLKIYRDSVRNLSSLKGHFGPETQEQTEAKQEDQSGKEG